MKNLTSMAVFNTIMQIISIAYIGD